MPGLAPGIYVSVVRTKDIDSRDRPAHEAAGKKHLQALHIDLKTLTFLRHFTILTL